MRLNYNNPRVWSDGFLERLRPQRLNNTWVEFTRHREGGGAPPWCWKLLHFNLFIELHTCTITYPCPSHPQCSTHPPTCVAQCVPPILLLTPPPVCYSVCKSHKAPMHTLSCLPVYTVCREPPLPPVLPSVHPTLPTCRSRSRISGLLGSARRATTRPGIYFHRHHHHTFIILTTIVIIFQLSSLFS